MTRRGEDHRHHPEREDDRADRDGDAQPARLLQPPLDPHALATGHEQADLLDGRRHGMALADDRALVHDENPVGERAQLVEVFADHEHGDALGGCVAQVRVNGLDGADVEPARWLRGHEHLRRPLELAAEHELLEVAAREVTGRGLGAWSLHVVLVDERARRLAHAAGDEQRAEGDGPCGGSS